MIDPIWLYLSELQSLLLPRMKKIKREVKLEGELAWAAIFVLKARVSYANSAGSRSPLWGEKKGNIQRYLHHKGMMLKQTNGFFNFLFLVSTWKLQLRFFCAHICAWSDERIIIMILNLFSVPFTPLLLHWKNKELQQSRIREASAVSFANL